MLRRIDRYVLKEILGPLTLGFLVYTFLLLMQFLFRSAEMIIRRDVPGELVGKLLLLTLPNIVVLTIPMSFLFGILVAVGRLASDSELIALRSCGISLFKLYRPIFALSLLLTALNMFLMVLTVPRTNSALQHLTIDILTGSATKQVEPRIFYEDWQGVVLYVFEAPPTEPYWSKVFVAEDDPTSTENKITVAERGDVRLDEESDRLLLHLEDAVIHEVDLNEPEKYRVSRVESLEQVLVDSYRGRQRNRRSSRGVRELTIPELRERLQETDLGTEMENLLRVEIHKKFSIPVAIAVFGLLALPLGYSSGRGSRSSGFALSIAVILVYYVLLNNGEEMARVGQMAPWLAMWLPNIVLAVAGVFLLVRRNSDRSLMLGGVDRWLRRTFRFDLNRILRRSPRSIAMETASTTGQGERGRADVVLRLPKLTLRFPNLMDRYIMRLFVGVILLVLLSGLSIYLIADLTDRVDDILKNDISGSVVFEYYRYLSLQIIYEISSVAVLVTTLIVFSLLSKTNEVTAAKSLGLSLYRLAIPAVVAALLVAVLGGFLQARILPATNERVAQLKDEIKGRTTARSYRRADRQWLFGQGRYIYNYASYDDDAETLERLQVFEFDQDGTLTRRLYSARAEYLGDAWLFRDGWVRAFDAGEVLEFRTFDQPVIDYYPETPEYFESEFKLPDAMTYRELKDYIVEMRASGQAVPELLVQLYQKISMPFAAIVMAMVALPFAFRLGKRGTLYGVGVGVVLGMVFFAMIAFTSTLGETGALPPLVAVWSPNIAFMILSLYLLLGVRS